MSDARIEIRDSNNQATYYLVIPISEEFYKSSIEFTPNNNETQIVFRTYNSNESLYVDNIQLQ